MFNGSMFKVSVAKAVSMFQVSMFQVSGSMFKEESSKKNRAMARLYKNLWQSRF
jgi:hypothetical protein